MEILRIENLSFKYPKADKNAVENASLSINKGDLVVVCGRSGCGKTTLLRLLKRELAPFGEKSGKVLYKGIAQDEIDERESACKIGFVMQDPDSQIVTDKVWHELAFGLENMGVKTEQIRLRVGETASYFGIQRWFRKNTDELSGGEKQLLNLASVMAMQPEVLILDEPTSQLDPIAASDFIATIKKLNRETGLTVILAEHRLEDVFPIADKVLVMDDGKVAVYDEPRLVGEKLYNIKRDHPMLCGLPSAVRIFSALRKDSAAKGIGVDAIECPLTVREGRDLLEKCFNSLEVAYADNISNNIDMSNKIDISSSIDMSNVIDISNEIDMSSKIDVSDAKDGSIVDGTSNQCDTSHDDTNNCDIEAAVELKNVWFRYERDLPDVLRGLSFKAYKGELLCIVGGNGTGKTTMLNVISGLGKAYRGKVVIGGKKISEYKNGSLYRNNLAFLPQNPLTVFIKDKVRDDLFEILKAHNVPKESLSKLVDDAAERLCIAHLLDKHPYDLSGGERQKCALAKMLLLEPKVLLLDEPTKGLDAYSKKQLGELICELKRSGIAIIMVTHDVEFAAENADRCALFFDGELIASGKPAEFFSENNFYTTAASRMSRSFLKNAVTCDQVVAGCIYKMGGGGSDE